MPRTIIHTITLMIMASAIPMFTLMITTIIRIPMPIIRTDQNR